MILTKQQHLQTGHRIEFVHFVRFVVKNTARYRECASHLRWSVLIGRVRPGHGPAPPFNQAQNSIEHGPPVFCLLHREPAATQKRLIIVNFIDPTEVGKFRPVGLAAGVTTIHSPE